MKLTRTQLRRIICEEVSRIAEQTGLDPSRLSQSSIRRTRAQEVFNTLQQIQGSNSVVGDIDPWGTMVTWDQLAREFNISREEVDDLAEHSAYNFRRQPYIRYTTDGIEFTAEGGYWEVG